MSMPKHCLPTNSPPAPSDNNKNVSDSGRDWSQDIYPPISQNVSKNFIKISLIIKNILKKF